MNMKIMTVTAPALLLCCVMSTATADAYGTNIATQSITTATIVEGDAVTSVTDTSIDTAQSTQRLGGTNISDTSRDAVQAIKGNYATVIDTVKVRTRQAVENH